MMILKPNLSELLLSQSIIKLSLYSILLFSSFEADLYLSTFIVLSPSIDCWPLKRSDYPLVAPRVYCDVNGGNRIQTGVPCSYVKRNMTFTGFTLGLSIFSVIIFSFTVTT